MAARALALSLSALLAASACEREPAREGSGRAILARLEHANGLRLDVPEGYAAAPTPAGFLVEAVDNERRRVPVEISIAWSPDAPAGERPRRRRLGAARVIRYAVAELGGGGSAGPEFEIEACEQVEVGFVCMRQLTQDEPFLREPSFQLWDIAPGVSFAAVPDE